jgi:hypothetical protein
VAMAKETLNLGHHYSSIELTGLTKEETKIRSILNYLSVYFCEDIETHTCKIKPNPNRRDLCEKISMALTEVTKKSIDRRVILKYIDYLIANSFIRHNPTSDISIHGHIIPNNDTRYFLNSSLIESKSNELSQKLTMGKSVCSVSLDSFKQAENVESQRIGNQLSDGKESEKVLCNLQKRIHS